jgi:hypothetical protein
MDATLCGLMSSFPAVPDIAKNLPLGALPLTKVYAISGASIFIVLLSESVSVQLLYSPHDFWTRAVVSVHEVHMPMLAIGGQVHSPVLQVW